MRRRSRHSLPVSAVRRSSARACTSGSASPARALDRILRVAPRFHADTSRVRGKAICAEAAATFGADTAMLWRRAGQVLELVCTAPGPRSWPRPRSVPRGLPHAARRRRERARSRSSPTCRTRPAAPGLERVRRLGTSLLVPDADRDRRRRGGARAHRLVDERDLGARSVDGRARRGASPTRPGSPSSRSSAGALEEAAAKRADETRRLQEITAALSLPSTSTEVTDTCLEHVLEAVGAEAGFVVLSQPEGVTVDFVTSPGYSDDELGTGERSRSTRTCRSRGRSRAASPCGLSTRGRDGRVRRGGELDDQGWVSMPLRTAAGVRGALHVTFRRPRELSDGRAAMAADGRLAVRAGARTQPTLRRGAGSAPALGPAPAHDRRALQRAHACATSRRSSSTRSVGARGRRRDCARDRSRGTPSRAAPGLGGYSDESIDARRECLRGSIDADARQPGGEAPRLVLLRVARGRDSPRGVSRGRGARRARVLPLRAAGRRPSCERRSSSRLWAEAVLTVPRGAAIRRSARGSGRPGARPRERTSRPSSRSPRRSSGAFSRRRFRASRACSSPLATSRARPELAVGGDWFDAIRLAGRPARPRRGRRRREGRAGGRDDGAAAERAARVLARPHEAVLDAHEAQSPRRGDHGDGVRDRRLRRHRRGRRRLPVHVGGASAAAGRLSGSRESSSWRAGEAFRSAPGPTREYTQEIVELPVGTTLVLYTDGLVERRGESDRRRARTRSVGGSRRPTRARAARRAHPRNGWSGTGRARRRHRAAGGSAARGRAAAAPPPRCRATSDSLDVVRDTMRSWLAGTRAERTDAHDVVLAVWEACANAIEHAVDPEDDWRCGPTLTCMLARADRRRGHGHAGRRRPTAPDRGFGLRLMRGVDVLGRHRVPRARARE